MTDNNNKLETLFVDGNSTYLSMNQTVVERIIDAISYYYTPFLIFYGVLGNVISLIVFYNSKLRLQSTSQYLSALAISDTVFLFLLLPPWLNAAQWSDVFLRMVFCQLFVYSSYVTCSLSAWLVVAFTVERFVAVLYPLQRNALCTVTRARYIILSIVFCALLLNIPLIRFAKPYKHDCSIDYDYMEHAARFNLVDFIITFSTPLVIIVVMNTWIMIGVWRLERARAQMMKEEQPPQQQVVLTIGTVTEGEQRARPMGCPRSQQRVTRMLLLVSSVFVVLNLPGYIIRMLAYTCATNTDQENNNRKYAAWQQVAMMFFNTNFGINFFLYCLSGQNFRRALYHSMPQWLRRRARRGDAARRATSGRPARASSVSASFVSNCTEATTNYTTIAIATPSARRQRRRETFITRWTFDNSRQRRQQQQQPPIEQFELHEYPSEQFEYPSGQFELHEYPSSNI